MQTVLEATDSGFSQYWKKLFANDPLQHPLYAQQAEESTPDSLSSTFTDRSFLVLFEGEPVFGCSLTMHTDESGRKHLGYFGLDAATHVNRNSMLPASNSFRPEAIQLLQNHMNGLLDELKPDSLNYLDPVTCGIMSPVSQVLFEKGAQPTVYQAQIIDLEQSRHALQHNLRTSYRGLVNWGQRNLHIDLIDGQTRDQVDPAARDRVLHQNLPAAGSGTSTSLGNFGDLLAQPRAFLVQGRYRNELVASALFAHSDRICYFIASDTTSDTPDRPVLHSMVWEAILHGKSLGCKQFDLGYSVARPVAVGADQEFAAGFGGTSHTRLKIKLNQ